MTVEKPAVKPSPIEQSFLEQARVHCRRESAL
jgi:hypothetical protein